MKISGAKAVIESLLKESVNTIFGFQGGAIMPIYDALYDYRDKINHILVRHEQGAIHAAEGYARITHKPGVCFSTSGPGATNLVTGIADAKMDSVPLVCITGQVSADVLGTEAFQEVDIINITKPITKWNFQVKKAKEIPEAIHKAFRIAQQGRPGPVLIDITKNAQFEKFKFSYPDKNNSQNKNEIDEIIIKKVTDLINTAKRPYVMAGHGVLISQAENELRQLIEKADLPTSVTLHGMSSLPTNHPLYIGMLGMHGNYSSNIMINHADVILAVGMRFDDRVTGKISEFAKNAKIIHIDVESKQLNKIVPTELAIQGDAKQILILLLKYIKKNNHSSWRNTFKQKRQLEFKTVIKQEINSQKEIKMGQVINLLSKFTKGKAIIVADVGQNQMMSAKYYQYKLPNTYITSGGLGTMGFALPASIGVQIGKPNNLIIAIIGDGGFQMTIQELATVVQEKLPIKILVLNNNNLGMVRQWQQLFFNKRYSFTQLQNPDFIKIAQGYKIKGKKVTKIIKLSQSLKQMLKSKGPYLLEVVVEKEGLVMPMIPPGVSVDQVKLYVKFN